MEEKREDTQYGHYTNLKRNCRSVCFIWV